MKISWPKSSVFILGAGGHAKVLLDTLKLCEVPVLGLLDNDPSQKGLAIAGVKVLGGDEILDGVAPGEIHLVNGIGSVRHSSRRREVFNALTARGYYFAQVIHPSAIVSSGTILGEGVQIMAGAVVQTDCAIGDDVIINTCSSIDHDCQISNHVHIAPGVVLSGGVTVGENTHVGTGVVAIQSAHIGEECTIGAGAVIVRDIPSHSTAYGLPAEPK